MLISGTPTLVQEVAGEDLHVAREHDQVDVADQQVEQRASLCALVSLSPARGGRERRRRRRRPRGRGGSRRRARCRRQLAAAPAPEQVEQAVVVAWRRGSPSRLRSSSSAMSPVHPEAVADVEAERGGELLPASSIAVVENSMRMKKRPPSGSVECCWELMMFAPWRCRKPETAATIPGWSGQEMSSRAVTTADPTGALESDARLDRAGPADGGSQARHVGRRHARSSRR